MSIDYNTWAAQQHQYLMSAGGYGPTAPPPPPPDQGGPIQNQGNAAVPLDAPPPPPSDADWQAQQYASGDAYSTGTPEAQQAWQAPPPPPPSGPTLGPSGANQAGPIMGQDPTIGYSGPVAPQTADQQTASDYGTGDAYSTGTPQAQQAWGSPQSQTSGYAANDAVNAALNQGQATKQAIDAGKADEQRQQIQQATPLVPPSQQQLAAGLGPVGVALNLAQQAGGASALAPLNPAANAVANVVADHAGSIAQRAKQVADQTLLAQTPGGDLDPSAGIHQAIQQQQQDLGPHSIVQGEQRRQAAGAAQLQADQAKIDLAQHNKSLGFMMSEAMAPSGEGLQSFLGHPETIKDEVGNAVGGAANWVVSHADLPRQKNIEHITQLTLDDIQGKSSGELRIPGWDTLQGGIVLRPFTDWMRANPDRAIGDATNGYGLDPTTGKPFTGNRAIWEDFIHDKPSWQRILYDAGADPLSYLPPADKAVEGVGVGARLLEGAGLPGAGKVAAGAEALHPWVEHPLQQIGARLPESVYPADVRAARAERQVVADAEKALNSPRVEPDPNIAQAAPNQPTIPQGPPSQPLPPPPNLPPAPTNGHAPTTALPPVTITPTGTAPLSPEARQLVEQAAPVEPGALGVEAPSAPPDVPPAPAPEPSANQQRLTQAQSDLAQMAQTGQVPPPTDAQMRVMQSRRVQANLPPPVRTDEGLDFGQGVVVQPRPDGRFQVTHNGSVMGQERGYATEQQAGGFAQVIAHHQRLLGDDLTTLKTVPADQWTAPPGVPNAAKDARARLYQSGYLDKRPPAPGAPPSPGHTRYLDLMAGRVNGDNGVDGAAVRAGLKDDLAYLPGSGDNRDPLNPAVYNEIMDKAGRPTEKIDPGTFYVGPADNRHPLITGAPVRNTDWPEGEVGTLEKATNNGLGVVVTRRGQQETVPLDKLDAHVIPTDHDASGQAVGVALNPKQRAEQWVNAVQQAHPNPLKQARLAPDLTQPIASNPWFKTLDPSLNDTLLKKINVGTFTNPNHVAIGDILAHDQDQLLGWKALRSAGVTHIDPPHQLPRRVPGPSYPGDPLFHDLFNKGIIDANGDLNESGINKTLVRLGLVDKQGAVTDLGRGLAGAQTADAVKAELLKSSDPFINHLIAKAAGVDFSVSEGVRSATSRALKDSRTGVGKALDGYMNFRRAVALTNLASGPRYGLMQAIGNAVSLAIAKPTALLDYVAPLEWRKFWQSAKDIRVTSESEHWLRDAGLSQSPLLREIGPMGKNPIAKATWLGPLQKPAQAAFANDVYRRFGNIFDNAIRSSLFKTKVDELYPRALGSLPDRVGDEFARLNTQLPRGAIPFPNWKDELTQAVKDIDPVGKKALSADELRRNLLTFYDDKLAANPALAGRLPGRGVWSNFADHMAETWDTALEGIKSAAETEVRRVAFDFDPTKADAFVSRMFMFHFWQSRAGGLYAVEALKNPKYVATFVRTMSALEQQAKAENAPAFLQWFYKYGQTPDGLVMWFNPTNLINVWSTGLLMNQQSGDDPTAKKDLTGLGHLLQGPYGSMAFMNPVLQGALTAIGALGPDAKTPDLIGDSQAMQRLETFINQWNVGHPTVTDGHGNPTLVTLPDSRTAINVALNWLHQQNPALGINPQNPNAGDTITFKNLLWDEAAKANPGAAPKDITAAATAMETDPSSPGYQAAYHRFVEGTTAGPGTGHGAIGDTVGWLARMGLGNSMFTTTDPAADAAAANDYASPEDQARAGFAFSSGPQEDQSNVAADQYKTAGGKDRVYFDVYNGIKYGTVGAYDDNGQLVRPEQLQQMTDDQRQHLADLWLASQPRGPAALQKVYDAQDQILKANPDLAGAKAMRQLADANPAGVDEWIATVRARNPGFDRYMAGFEQKTGGTTNDDYRTAAFYPDAYAALVGQPRGYNSVATPNPHPDVPGLENGETLAEHYFAQQAEARGTGDGGKQGTLDDLRAVAKVKAAIDAYDPNGNLWQVYLQNAALPKEQRTKLPYGLYTQIKGAIPGKDGAAYDYPAGYALMFLQQDQPFEDWWVNSAPQRRLAQDAKDATDAAFDPNSLNGSATPAPADQTPAQGQAVTTANLNLRDGPNGNVLTVAPFGTTVDWLDVQGDWVKVRLADGTTGWMAWNYLRKQ